MVRLSVNVNKVAVLRNSRGGNEPCLIQVVEDLIRFGVWGITVHPRPDGRHIFYQDVRDIAQCVQKYPSVEFNVEGYPSEKFLDLIQETKPHQCTLVPDPPEALTSDQGWDLEKNFSFLEKIKIFLKENKVRSSIFMDPLCCCMDFLEKLRPDRVEFYTGKWADVFDHAGQKDTPVLGGEAIPESPVIPAKAGISAYKSKNPSSAGMTSDAKAGEIVLNEKCLKILKTYRTASEQIHQMGIGINAGHDLNQHNLKILLQEVPLIQEVSIGHAFISEALYDGLKRTLEKYHSILDSTQ